MEMIAWNKRFNIGVEIVDRAHARLFRVTKKLFDMSEEIESNQHTFKEGLKYLEAYTMTHFSEEEAYMRSIRYKKYARHKRIHDNFRDETLVSLKRELELSGYSTAAIQHFMAVLNHWLAEHILVEDQAIVGRCSARRKCDFSAQIPIISRAVHRTISELFQAEAALVNENYKGQNIGDGFYCQKTYDLECGLRLQILLGVEEPLFLRGVNWILGTEITQKSELTNRAVLSLFERLFHNMSKLFRIESEDRLEENNLLNRDEFRTEFMKNYPCSLLFNTKIGYFVFCYRSWHVKRQTPKALLEIEQNMAKV